MPRIMLHHDETANLFGALSWRLALGLLLLLGPGWARAQAPNLAYSAPVIIRHGGTYTGNYRSTDSAVPVVLIETTEPVVLANCTLVGPGDLIYCPFVGDLTVRECRGYGATPTADNVQRGGFLYMHRSKNLLMEHNYLESNQGVVLDRWAGDGSPDQTVKIRYNRSVNLDGRYRNDPSPTRGPGFACFALLNTVLSLPNLEIGWNQIVNQPNQSSPGDNLNFYNSGGTPANPARVHDNYVQGAYPNPATSPDFNGTGMTTDGEGTTAATSTGFLEIDHNQFVSTCNGGINIAAGHDVNVHHNRVVTSGYLSGGARLEKLWCGINPSNFYHTPEPAAFGNIRLADNTVGYACWGPRRPYPNRFDLDSTFATVYTGNIHLPNPITLATEQNEWTLWQQKLQANNVTPGPTGAPVPAGALGPPAAPVAPANAAFYRAFDLNGPGGPLAGHVWESGAAAGLQVGGAANGSAQYPSFTPFPDAAQTRMLGTSVVGSQVRLTVGNVPAANYWVYLYVWESDGAPRTYSVAVNGQTVQTNYSSGARGHWDRLGPFAAAVGAAGTLAVATSGGEARCAGLEIWRAAPVVSAAAAPAPGGLQLTVYPNPGPGDFTVGCVATAAQGATLALLDGLGRRLMQQRVQLKPGENRFGLAPGRDVSAGLYQVVLTADDGRLHQARKLVITR